MKKIALTANKYLILYLEKVAEHGAWGCNFPSLSFKDLKPSKEHGKSIIISITK